MYLWISFDVYVDDHLHVVGGRYRTSSVVSIDVTGMKSSVCLTALVTASEFLALSDHEFKPHKAGQFPDSFEGKIWHAIKRHRVWANITSMRMTHWNIVKAFD